MKIESRIFEICAGFFFLCGIVYTVLTQEPVGVAALFLTGGLGLIIGTYFRFVSRRLEQRPEDNPDAEVSDGAGDVGFFSPGSYWPMGVAAACAVCGVALAFWQVWLLVIGAVLVLLAVGGLVFEYHLPPRSH
ncbi:Cytochrome c oxidase subunit IV [Pseudonocardia thermophila]|jgi:Cytochrome c oxidase subunit IV.|uniref:Cytochrome c oxidase polypeptide 4 n=1 Tax=Pseudonocardia thermophila TaxID=1848 RepID=A0A1M6R2C8_PSETH|nr:cytochrome c oxidase subunit 4 [Pseudonocardia thermophila]SHK26507.1 Cytochrome c oxidase subunit IV [Pseudonocardia thermophila]